MFTGIIEEIGLLKSLNQGENSAKLQIKASKILENTVLGDSIAVNGVCLTVTDLNNHVFTADVMAETLKMTNLGQLTPGSELNLERALRLGDRLDGHMVSGHIDGVGYIVQREKNDIAILLTVEAPPDVMRYIIPKGSIAIDGTSLTVVEHTENTFMISMIPHTAEQTILGRKKVKDAVNLENDLIGKYIERLIRQGQPNEATQLKKKSKINHQFLLENGFI